MVVTGTNYRLHMYNPDQIGVLPNSPILIDPLNSEETAYMFPFKKVLRDTKINQLTYYLDIFVDNPFAATVTAQVCLYRCVGSLIDPVGGGRIIAEKVAGSTVTTGLVAGAVNRTQWAFDAPIHLQGGTYWIAITYVVTNIGGRDPLTTIISHIGITDTDSNILYPKYDLTLANYLTFTQQINITAMSRKVDYWHYASGEWY